jgi:hypothetical protein
VGYAQLTRATASIFKRTGTEMQTCSPVEKARKAFFSLSPVFQAPSLHPDYVCADALRDSNLVPSFFIFDLDGDIFYHAFHIGQVPGKDCFDVQSPYGYGGPVATTYEKNFLSRAWDAYFEWCRERRIVAEFIRFHPLLENWRFYWGDVIDDRETVWVDLAIENVLDSYHLLRRRNILKAKQGSLSVSWAPKESFLQYFIPLYEAMLDKKTAAEFYFFNWSYYKALLDCTTCYCAVCWRGNEAVAAGIFLLHGETMEYHLGAASADGQKSGAMTLLLHEAALLAQRRGAKAFHLGGGTDRMPENSLLFFKRGFSDRRGLFKIGKYVHEARLYSNLKFEWETEHNTTTQQVLFYRF